MQLRRRLVSQKSKLTTPATAVVTSVALVAAAAFGGNHILNTQSEGGVVQATTSTANFGDGETVVVDDPAIASQGEGSGPRAVKQFHQDEPFTTFGVTWKGRKDVAVFVRAKQEDGTWSEWYNAEPTDMTTDGTNGTDPIWVGQTNDVQVSVGNVDLGAPSEEEVAELGGETQPKSAPEHKESGAESSPDSSREPADHKDTDKESADQKDAGEKAATPKSPEKDGTGNKSDEKKSDASKLPSNYGDIQPVAETEEQDAAASDSVDASDLEAVFIDGKTQSGIEPTAETVSDGMPPVVSRSGWGADESQRCMEPEIDDGVKALTLHHTAGSNNYTKAEAPAVLRGIYQYHAQTLGWCDIGYNALVDKYGTIYEGRYGGLDKAVQGAHVGGFNQNTWGISMMGNYQTAQPTQEMLHSVAEIAGWKAAISGFDPTGEVSLTSQGFNGSRYPAGSVATVPAFQGHRDFHYTTCPGDYAVAQWPTIRKWTKEKYDQVRAGAGGSGNSGSTSDSQSDSDSTATSESQQPSTPQNSGADLPSAEDQNSKEQSGGTHTELSSNGLNLGPNFTSKQQEAFYKLASAVGRLALAAGVVQPLNQNQEIVAGLTATDITDIIGKILRATGDQNLQKQWAELLNAFGPLLGTPQGGPDMVKADGLDVAYQLFDNGVVLSSDDTGAHALLGEIAKAWSKGDNATSLGLPITDQYSVGKNVRVDFQGGHIDYDAQTKQVNVYNN